MHEMGYRVPYLTPLQANILKVLEIAPPPRFQMIEPVAPEAARAAS